MPAIAPTKLNTDVRELAVLDRAGGATSALDEAGPMTGNSSPKYDSFVVRLWREPTEESVRRAEIMHVQSAIVHRGKEVGFDWIIDRLRALHTEGIPVAERGGNEQG